jgi:hypothetical protein
MTNGLWDAIQALMMLQGTIEILIRIATGSSFKSLFVQVEL